MPFVDIHSNEDYCALYYITNTTFNNVAGFDFDKPTVCILPPQFLDSGWLDSQFEDPRLNDDYNIIAFDIPRCCGQSEFRPSGRTDSWTDAADLALASRALNLPPMHILAFEGMATTCALRFAALFPEMCLSLALCNVPPETELMWIYSAYNELIQTWCYTEDIEGYEYIASEAVTFAFGANTSVALRDEVIGYWSTNTYPQKRQRALSQANLVMNRTPLPPAALQSITQPILMIHGDANETAPRKYAERLATELKAIFYPVKGGAGYLNLTPGTASIVNQVYVKFLSRLPRARSDPPEYPTSTHERMRDALSMLERITGETTMSTRDPMCPLSFCALEDKVVKTQTEMMRHYGKEQTLAFVPFNPVTKRPLRRYSERPKDEWAELEKEGTPASRRYTAAGTSVNERPLPMPQSEPILPNEGRLRKANFNAMQSVEKQVIKGSMAKVVGSQTPTLQKLFL
uniref:AB hydrolase-1 domain-containing protein n=1 Tax=Mycena chlorophos TaxID=658473 RepID=A0ABQ0L506_MYCCL|nr:predicted protein [Mycena chlorophos]